MWSLGHHSHCLSLRPAPCPFTLETEEVHHRGNIWGNELEKILVCSQIRQVTMTKYHRLTG